MGDHDPADKGYVKAHIDQGERAFDAGAYSFFGDMAPLDDGLGGALEDGLEAPPEELPAEEGALDDEEDLPIEDLLDNTDEEEDLSLAALLRRRMQQADEQTNGVSSKQAAAVQQHEQPMLPPMPPQPQTLSSRSHHHAPGMHEQQQQQQQQQHPFVAQQSPQQQLQLGERAAAALAAAAAAAPQLQDPATLDAVVPAPAGRTVAAKATPSNVMTAEELEARMLRSAEAPPSDSRGNQLLSMLQGGAAAEQQQRQASPLHAHDPAIALAQQQMQLGITGAPMGPRPLMRPPFPPGQPGGPPHMLPQQQHGPGGMLMPPHPGAPMPPPEALAQLQQQQQLMPGQQPPPFMGPPPPHLPGGPLPPVMQGPGVIGPGGAPPPFHGMPQPGMGPQLPPQSMPQQMPPMPPHPGHPGAPSMGLPMPPFGPGAYGPRGPPLGPGMMPPQAAAPGPLDMMQQQQRLGMPRPGQELMHGPGQPPFPGQLGQAGGAQPFPNGQPLPGQLQQQRPAGFKQQALPPPGFTGPPAGMQQRQGSPGGMRGAPQQQQQQQQQPGQSGGQQLPPWATPGPTGPGPRPDMPQQQQQQGPPSGGAGFGGEYMATATAAPADAVRVVSPAALVHQLRTNGSTWMAADDINYILRIQHASTHSGVPYVEDFYFQAFCNKYFGGRNAVIFAPQQLRELGSELHLDLEPRFADLTGLGKVVLSNIRTPKMLMDVGGGTSNGKGGRAADTASADQQQQEEHSSHDSKARPLEQEPMLAARIMVEDCMLLLCDVEDIDRMFAGASAAGAAQAAGMPFHPHSPGPISPQLAQGLLQRRVALLGGIAASFRLPDTPTLAGDDAGGAAGTASSSGDRVFVRILALPKGRSLITKTLKLMFSSPATAGGSKGGAGKAAALAANGSNGIAGSSAALGLDVIWALLRNAQLAFGPPLVGSVGEAERRLTDATIALSGITQEMVKRLQTPRDAVACLAAAVAGLSAPAHTAAQDHQAAAANGNGSTGGCQLLPLYPAGRVSASASPEWLGSILGSLLLRASELGLGSFAAAAAAAPVRSLGDGAPDEAELLAQQAEAVGVPAAVSAEWQALLNQLVQLVQLHLWQLVQAVRGNAAGVAAAAGAGPGSVEVLQASIVRMACVPLMRVLMAHCSEEQQEQLKGYLSEVGR